MRLVAITFKPYISSFKTMRMTALKMPFDDGKYSHRKYQNKMHNLTSASVLVVGWGQTCNAWSLLRGSFSDDTVVEEQKKGGGKAKVRGTHLSP